MKVVLMTYMVFLLLKEQIHVYILLCIYCLRKYIDDFYKQFRMKDFSFQPWQTLSNRTHKRNVVHKRPHIHKYINK